MPNFVYAKYCLLMVFHVDYLSTNNGSVIECCISDPDVDSN